MLEELKNCPVCNHEQFEHFKNCKDFTVSQTVFAIVKCKNCGFKFTNPRPTEETIESYYKSEEYISHTNSKKGIINTIYQLVRKKTLKDKVDLINSLIPQKGRILDIGCGTGYFLKACKDNQWKVSGIEPDEDARKLAKSNTNEVINSGLFCCYDESDAFDIVTTWHVVEHIHQLNENIEKISQIMKSKGIFIIAVPNADSLDAKIYQENWAAYDVPRHLYHFNQLTIKQLVEKQEFKLIATKPMYFDSYYVSLLSEKNIAKDKNTSTNYLKSFINGYKSNKWAKNNNNNYSSLIYIFKKN